MMTICFIGDPNNDYSSFNWMTNAQELGFHARLNNISGLNKGDVIIIDKYSEIDFSSCPARKILYFPDMTRTARVKDKYLKDRTRLLLSMAPKVDIIVMPPNREAMEYASRTTGKPVFKMLFGVFTRYFDFIPPFTPAKSIEKGFCWSPGSLRRDRLIARYDLVRVSGTGRTMIEGLSRCVYAFNAHYSSLLNNEQRLTEIPLAMTIPVSEPLADPEQLSELYIIPIQQIDHIQIEPTRYEAIVNDNLALVKSRYNSRESLKLILSYLRK